MSLKRKLIVWYYRAYYFLQPGKALERSLKRQHIVFTALCSKAVRDPSLIKWEDLDTTGWTLDEITARMG